MSGMNVIRLTCWTNQTIPIKAEAEHIFILCPWNNFSSLLEDDTDWHLRIKLHCQTGLVTLDIHKSKINLASPAIQNVYLCKELNYN